MTTFELDGVRLVLPEGHSLPLTRKLLPDYSENVGRMAAAVERKYPGRGFIDVGANVGDTAAIVRSHSNLPILSIEGLRQYFDLLRQNASSIADIELECATVDSSSGARHGEMRLELGTAWFRPEPSGAKMVQFERLDTILTRHPRFLSSKVLKLDTDGMDGRIILGALDWIAAARPVIFWEHDSGRDAAADGPALNVFRDLFQNGYRKALVFDNKGDYIQTVALDSTQQLADLSEYLPGGTQQLFGYCDFCAFHEEDTDLCADLRETELGSRRDRREADAMPLRQPLFQALVEAQFAAHRLEVTQAIHHAISQAVKPLGRSRETELANALASRTAELQVLRAQTEMERNRQQALLRDQEKRIAVKEADLHKLQVLLHEVLAMQTAKQPKDDTEERRLHEEMRRCEHETGELQARLAEVTVERDKLIGELQNSLALRVARSLHWILEPLRRLLVPGASSQGGPG